MNYIKESVWNFTEQDREALYQNVDVTKITNANHADGVFKEAWYESALNFSNVLRGESTADYVICEPFLSSTSFGTKKRIPVT